MSDFLSFFDEELDIYIVLLGPLEIKYYLILLCMLFLFVYIELGMLEPIFVKHFPATCTLHMV
jgi:hypothetical protein